MDINDLILSKIAELNTHMVKLTAKGEEPCSLAKDPGHPGDNWVTEEGGLPRYICNVAKHIKEDGHTTSQAIAMAVSQIKKWIADPNTSAETKAKATAAIAEWERKKAGSHATVKSAHAKLSGEPLSEDDTIALSYRSFSSNSRDKYAKSGIAMSDGSFPIPDKDALRRAIQSIGRAPASKRAAVKAHIRKRAKALGATDMIPKDW